MRACFVSDLFEIQIIGGAEKNDAVLINYLQKQGVDLTIKKSDLIDPATVNNYDFFIISNFILLSEDVKQFLIKNKKYIIYEHDHKYVVNRNPATFVNYEIPKDKLVNIDFYKNAQNVIVLSKICKEIIEKNLELKKAHSIGCSLWSDEQFDLIKTHNTTEKENEYGILDSANPIKGTREALAYCQSKNIKPVMINSPDYNEFLQKLSTCKNFIFCPQVIETYSRVCAEAKMLGCNVLTMPKMCGFFSEEYSKLSGDELIEEMRERKNKALDYFMQLVKEA